MYPEKPVNPDVEQLSSEVDEFHAEMRRRLDEIDEKEAYYEKRRKPIPEKMYHATTHQNAQRVMREGLDPSKLIFEDREVVGLSDDIDFAMRVAQETQQTTAGNLVILEIDTRHLNPSRIENYLRTSDPKNPDPTEAAAIHEVHYESTIPPDAIKIVKLKREK